PLQPRNVSILHPYVALERSALTISPLSEPQRRPVGLPTICQPGFVAFFTPSARPAHDASGLPHSTYDDVAWPSGYAVIGRQCCVRPGHAAAPSPATLHTRCSNAHRAA